jgi:hypothetical protein
MSKRSPHLIYAGEKVLCPKGPGGLPTIESLAAMVEHLTGKRPTQLEILEAKLKLEVFLAEKAAEQAALSGTPVAPAKRQPGPLTEEESGAEESETRRDPLLN